jgi:hypothetical protein
MTAPLGALVAVRLDAPIGPPRDSSVWRHLFPATDRAILEALHGKDRPEVMEAETKQHNVPHG